MTHRHLLGSICSGKPGPNRGTLAHVTSTSTTLKHHSAPTPISSLVGRSVELDNITTLLQRQRLVTLVGPGGVGKTRLAQHVALGQVQHPDRAVRWVELAGVSDADRVEKAVATGIGTMVRAADGATDVIVRWISAEGPTFLVLDNAEHLLDRLVTVVDTMLGRCPDLRVLTTSRAPLGVHGETLFEVPPLSLPPPEASWPGVDLGAFDATRLFVERVRQGRPNFTIDETPRRPSSSSATGSTAFLWPLSSTRPGFARCPSIGSAWGCARRCRC